jgi:hypothetical protein
VVLNGSCVQVILNSTNSVFVSLYRFITASRWKGVKVDPQNGHINKLILPSNNLAGRLPGTAFLELPYLIELDLRENKINGKSYEGTLPVQKL